MKNSDSSDSRFMALALSLAQKGAGRVSPNPMVGAVIVRNGSIVGQGYHEAYGKPHAEAAAIEKAGEHAKGADLYVTLEPCNHTGKTPPCTQAILNARIRRVIIAVSDPNPEVTGGGADFLKANGVEVETGLMESEARFQNRFFFKSIDDKRPYVILKWAMSLDGATAARNRESAWISNETSRNAVHQLRHEVDGVCVGAQTVRIDDPLLTCRNVEHGSNPKRVIIDPDLKTSLKGKLAGSIDQAPLIFLVREGTDPKKKKKWGAIGAECIEVPEKKGMFNLKKGLSLLYERRITSLLVEGGGVTAGAFVDQKLADEVMAFCAPCLIGGETARPLLGQGIPNMTRKIEVCDTRVTQYGNDVCIRGRIVY